MYERRWMVMQYFTDKTFVNQLRKMRLSGGQSKNAAERIQALIYRITDGDKDPFSGMTTTNFGESRIKKCVKYDLPGRCRLVTVVYETKTIFLFAGTHAEADKWLARNAGIEFVATPENEIGKTQRPSRNKEPAEIDTKYVGPLFLRLDQNAQKRVSEDIPAVELLAVFNLQAGASEYEIDVALEPISDSAKRDFIRDVLLLLNSGEIEGALTQIDLHKGLSKSLAENALGEIVNVKSGREIIEIEVGSTQYTKWLDNFLKAEHAFEWFLFMHPEQQKFVDLDYNGPAKLSGVSGSGKTSVAIKRAIRLANKYPNENLLLVTINKSLSKLISDIVTYACDDQDTRRRIHVKSFADVALDLLRQFDPNADRHFRFEALVLDDHKDEVYRNFIDAAKQYRCKY